MRATSPPRGSEILTPMRWSKPAVGLTGDYARALVAAGIPPNLHDYVQLRTLGVPASYVLAIRKSGRAVTPHQIVQMWAVRVKPSDLNIVPPVPPRLPSRRTRPAASPPDWDPVDTGKADAHRR